MSDVAADALVDKDEILVEYMQSLIVSMELRVELLPYYTMTSVHSGADSGFLNIYHGQRL